MHPSNVQFLDLPNEILLIILRKLDNMDVLYSLVDVDNQRLDQIVQEKTFTQTLDFVLTTPDDDIISLPDPILDRFCIHILPKIHHNVTSLTIESASIERILLAGDYSNLTELKIFNFKDEFLSNYFTDQSSFRRVFRQQITHLIIEYKTPIEISVDEPCLSNVHEYLFKFFGNLKHFSVTGSPILLSLRDSPSTTFSSSTLSKLCVSVREFYDILALLDGRLKSLTSLAVATNDGVYSSRPVKKMNDLPDLKYFSLRCICPNAEYDIHVLPLLRRMSNLEELILNIENRSRRTCVDGTQIHDGILTHMPLLHKFDFYIRTKTARHHAIPFVSTQDIRQTFRNIGYPDVNCIIRNDYIEVSYDVFSVPFVFDRLECIGNKFPPLLFNRVTYLGVNDTTPFAHAFFARVARFFPSLKHLSILNGQGQSSTSTKSNFYGNQRNSVVEYPYLVSLEVNFCHMDYVEQFLNETKTRLPRLKKLNASYEQLAIVTWNFTRETTRRNCARVRQISLNESQAQSKAFYLYFPLL